MNRLFGLLAAGLVLAAGASSASADVVFSQPYIAPGFSQASQNDTSGQFGNFAISYDNFSLANGTSVTGLNWVGGISNGVPGTVTGFNISFYADAAGQPGALLSSQFIAGDGNQSAAIGQSLDDSTFYNYSASLANPFVAQPGQEYWLSIVADLDYLPQWGWATTQFGAPGNSVQDFDFFDADGNFLGSERIFYDDFNQSFELIGQQVPEPATLAVFGLMAAGAYGVRRRKAAKA